MALASELALVDDVTLPYGIVMTKEVVFSDGVLLSVELDLSGEEVA